MWKFVVSWGLFLFGVINSGNDKSLYGERGFERVGSDSAIFFNRDSAFTFMEELTKNHLTPPRRYGHARALAITIDSVWVEPKRKRFLFFKL